MREKNIIPVAHETARRQAGESVAFPDEMRLIEIAELVNDIGPRPVRVSAASDQHPVEPDRSGKEFWCHSDLCRKATLELTGTQTRFGNEFIDPRIAADGDHLA